MVTYINCVYIGSPTKQTDCNRYSQVTHRYGGPNVFVVDWLVNGFVKLFFQPVRFPQLHATVGVCGTGHEVHLNVWLVDRLIGVFGVYESESLYAAHDRQRPIAHCGVVQNRLHVFDSFLRQRHLQRDKNTFSMTTIINIDNFHTTYDV